MKPFAFLLAVALAACAGPARDPAPPVADDCRVEPQPLSCAGAEDTRMGARR